MNKVNIEECARCFIRRIALTSRGSKRVNLLHEKWDGSLVDPVWVSGALQTTALRKRPKVIPEQEGGLGYAVGKNVAVGMAKGFLFDVRRDDGVSYNEIFETKCEELEREMSLLGLYWTFGRSQKFFNILTKYWFCIVLGFPERLDPDDRDLVLGLSDQFNAAIDSITIKNIRGAIKVPQLDGVYWGWNMSRKNYHEIQCLIGDLAEQRGVSKVAYELSEIW